MSCVPFFSCSWALCLVVLSVSASTVHAQWTIQPIDTTADFRGLSVHNSSVAWVGGTQGTIGRTEDGGRTWTVLRVAGAEKLDFRDIEAFSATRAVALSIGPGTDSRIYKTTDGGKSWTLQFQNADPRAFYDAIAFWDESHGIALSDPVEGRYRILVTDDGGANWAVQPSDRMPQALVGEGAFAASGTCLITRGENDACFVTGGGTKARLFHSTDRGRSWTAREIPVAGGQESAGAFSIAFRDAKDAKFVKDVNLAKDAKQGLIVGGNYKRPSASGATAAFTADGGTTWTPRTNALPFRSCAAWAKDRWFAVGPTGTHTSPDGLTWTEFDTGNWNATAFAPDGTGWAVGPKGRIGRFSPQR